VRAFYYIIIRNTKPEHKSRFYNKKAGPPAMKMKLSIPFLSLLVAAAVPVFAQQEVALPAFELSSGTPLLVQAGSSGSVVGQGGNYAAALPDGGVFWLLNNLWVGESREDGQSAVWGIVDGAVALSRSTGPVARGATLDYVSDENGWPLSLLSGNPGEYSQARKFRPRAGVAAGGKYYVFYSVLNNFGPEFYDYFRVGQGLAWSENPAGPYQKAPGPGGQPLWNDIEPAFGSALWPDEDGWLYVYGRVMTEPGRYGAALARVKPEDLPLREKYSYYSVEAASGAWTDDVSEASVALEDAPEEFSVSYNDFLKSYLAVSLDQATGRVLARQAPEPWGPWSAGAALLACKEADYCEGAKEQAVFAADGGRKIFLTLEKKNVPYLYSVTFKQP